MNALTVEQFEWLFGNVIELTPEAAVHVASARPFASCRHIKLCFHEYLDKLDVSEMEDLLLKYPDILGKLTEESPDAEPQYEEENIKFDAMSKEEKQSLSTYNNLYKEKFHIPFVTCTWDSKDGKLLASIQTRLQDTKENELQIAIGEVKKICNRRIDHLVWADV